MPEDHDFKLSGESNPYGEKKNSCLKCGKTRESHHTLEVHFAGHIFVFSNTEEAKKKGFYLNEN